QDQLLKIPARLQTRFRLQRDFDVPLAHQLGEPIGVNSPVCGSDLAVEPSTEGITLDCTQPGPALFLRNRRRTISGCPSTSERQAAREQTRPGDPKRPFGLISPRLQDLLHHVADHLLYLSLIDL